MMKGYIGTKCWRGHEFNEANPYRRGGCLICKRENSVAWRKRHPEGNRDNYRKSKYGVDRETFDRMLLEQGNKCKICRIEFKSTCKVDTPHIDHSHRGSRKVRGLLCHKCNVLIANALDSVLICVSAAKYLTDHAND
jgi:Recombination endonuclease VII